MSASARIELDRLDNVHRRPQRRHLSGRRQRRWPMSSTADRQRRARSPFFARGRDEMAIASGLQEGDRIALRDPTNERNP